MMRYRLLLVAATVIWGSTFVMVKDATAVVPPAWILVLRFFTAAAILAVVFRKKLRETFSKRTVWLGFVLGVTLFCSYFFQTVGIQGTTPGKNAFLTATYCVMVPFMAWAVTKKKPGWVNIAAAVMCIVGVGLVSVVETLSLGWGDGLTLVSAVFYGINIVLIAVYSQEKDVFALTVWEFFFVGVFALVAGFTIEQPPVWSAVPAGTWASLAWLAVAATAVALLLQNLGQKHVPPSSAALLLSLESVFGVTFSVLLGRETLSAQTLAGFALIFAAIVVSEALPGWLEKRRAARPGPTVAEAE